jgi:hypothetical protein
MLKRAKDRKYGIVILFLTLFLFYVKGVFSFLSAKHLAGLDLVGNLSFAWLMNSLMKGFAVSGWTNLWFAGMPAFVFYPPLFFIVVNALHFLAFGLLPLDASYRLVVFLSLFLPPLITFWCMKGLFSEVKTFFLSLWSLAFVFLFGRYSAVHQTLNFGLVTQMFALCLFVFLVCLLLHKRFYLAGVFLGLVMLSNAFVGLMALLVVFIYLALNRKEWRSLLITVIIGIVVSAFWLVSAFANIQYVSTYARAPVDIREFPFLLLLFVPFALIKRDKKDLFLILCFLAAIIIGSYGFGAYLQFNRFFFFAVFLASLVAGLGFSNIYDFLAKHMDKKVVLLVLILPLLFLVYQASVFNQWESDLETSELMDWLRANATEGRILVEAENQNPDYYTLMERIPVETGKEVLTELHTDSSISAPYVLTLQYEISPSSQPHPVCEICRGLSKKEKDQELILKQMKKFNVKYVIATTEDGKKFLEKFLLFRAKRDGFWIFETPFRSAYYEILKYRPVLVVSDMKTWKEFNNLIFMDRDLIDVTFVHSYSPQDVFDITILLKDMKAQGTVFRPKNETLTEFIQEIKPFLKQETGVVQTVDGFYHDSKVLKIQTSGLTALLLKFSHFPAHGKETYLASPGLTFAFVNKTLEISR